MRFYLFPFALVALLSGCIADPKATADAPEADAAVQADVGTPAAPDAGTEPDVVIPDAMVDQPEPDMMVEADAADRPSHPCDFVSEEEQAECPDGIEEGHRTACWCLTHQHDDTDGDGFTDGQECFELETNPCQPEPECDHAPETAEACYDGIDNDCDGDTDEADEDCDDYCHPAGGGCDDDDEFTEDFCSPQTWQCQHVDLDSDNDGIIDREDCAPLDHDRFREVEINGEILCIGENRRLQLRWSPTRSVTYVYNRETGEHEEHGRAGVGFPEEVDQLYIWASCWNPWSDVWPGEPGFYTAWTISRTFNPGEQFEIHLDIPDGRTLACQWEVYGLRRGEEPPLAADGAIDINSNINQPWESVTINFANHNMEVFGIHEERWSDADPWIESDRGSYNGPFLHAYTPVMADRDRDHIPDVEDNCPDVWNAGQLDSDEDGVGDECEEE